MTQTSTIATAMQTEKDTAAGWFRQLRDDIVAAFEAV